MIAGSVLEGRGDRRVIGIDASKTLDKTLRPGHPDCPIHSGGDLLAARTEGMVTDPIYEGKSMAGLICMVRSSEIPAGSRVLYAHLGGQPACPPTPTPQASAASRDT
jgi:1-aminocyclopropane-1-carboxylate deaminase